MRLCSLCCCADGRLKTHRKSLYRFQIDWRNNQILMKHGISRAPVQSDHFEMNKNTKIKGEASENKRVNRATTDSDDTRQ